MKKKILIGSIIAVVLLTLVSFSSVVGYSSAKSDSKIASPLFSVKNNRGEVSSNYIGKGKEINIPLPKRTNDEVSIKKIVDIIQNMDDDTFDRFVNFIITQLHQKDDLQEYSDKEIVLSLNQLRENQEKFEQYKVINNYFPKSDGEYTYNSVICFLEVLFTFILVGIMALTFCFWMLATLVMDCGNILDSLFCPTIGPYCNYVNDS